MNNDTYIIALQKDIANLVEQLKEERIAMQRQVDILVNEVIDGRQENFASMIDCRICPYSPNCDQPIGECEPDRSKCMQAIINYSENA